MNSDRFLFDVTVNDFLAFAINKYRRRGRSHSIIRTRVSHFIVAARVTLDMQSVYAYGVRGRDKRGKSRNARKGPQLWTVARDQLQ